MEINFDDIYSQFSKNTKQRIFMDYIRANFHDQNLIDVLGLLDESDILDSLSWYIATGIKYQITANNYMTYVKGFFDALSKQYGIKNILYMNKDVFDHMTEASRKIIETLKESEVKAISSDLEKNILEIEVQNQIYTLNKMEDRNHRKYHNKLVSIIATKLVLTYGFKNEVLVRLELKQFNAQEEILEVEDIKLALPKDLNNLIKQYLIRRDIMMTSNNMDSDLFFIKSDGKDYIGKKNPDYASLFNIVDNYIGSVAMAKYAYRSILDLIIQGVDIVTISKFTGFGIGTCSNILEYYNKDVRELSNMPDFNQILHDDKTEKYMTCTCCHRRVSAAAKEWVVVAYEDSDDKTIACRYCEGLYENEVI